MKCYWAGAACGVGVCHCTCLAADPGRLQETVRDHEPTKFPPTRPLVASSISPLKNFFFQPQEMYVMLLDQ